MSPRPVEVVVPARDAAATLPACLKGLHDAGFAPADVVVVCDGSTDATPAIAREFGARMVRSETPLGAAGARNLGVAETDAPIVAFVDADVALHADGRARILAFFADHPGHAGLIGSYDDAPPAPGVLSRVRNLLHHHAHQISGGDVPSFWTGYGAIRRADFDAVGGFERGHPLEDVALGLALARTGRRVRLAPDLQCAHLKHWTLRSMVRADLFYRALPWSRMLLDPGNGDIPAALNAGRAGKIAVVLTGLFVLSLPLALVTPWALVAGLVAVAALAWQSRDFLGLVARRLGRAALPRAVAVLLVHHTCAGAGYAWALAERVSSPS